MTDTIEGAQTVGTRLRAAREEQGQTIDDIGRVTRVPVRHLVQIEAGNLGGLPAAPYSAGFVKAYARAVGLDGNLLSQEFRADLDQAQRGRARIAYEPYQPADPSRLPPRLLALVALGIAILLVAGYALWRSGLLTGEGPAVRADLAAHGDPNVPAAPAPTPARPGVVVPSASVAPAGGPVVLTAKSDSWIKVSERGGATLFIGTLAAGKSFTVPATAADPVIRTGKPEGLDVTVGGKPVAPLGAPASVVANVSLKGEALLARGAAAGAAATVGAPPPAADVPPAFANSSR